MRVAVFHTKPYDKLFLSKANEKFGHKLTFFEVHLNKDTCKLAFGYDVACVFVNDTLNKEVLTLLAQHGIRLIALRCAGVNNVDLQAAQDLNLAVARVPAYSPQGVAEHAVALILALNRKIYRAYNRVHDGNFSLEGLLGYEIGGRTVGIIGTGRIGAIVAKIMKGFSTKVLAYDPYKNQECIAMGVEYVSLKEIYKQSDMISLHIPLTKDTYHLIDDAAVAQMKQGVMIINTSRGGLVDTKSVIKGLKSGKIGFLGLDVYEEEGDIFFEDLSGHIIQDDTFARLLAFPNVVITGHQAFFTQEALDNISYTTLSNITAFERGQVPPENCVTVSLVKK
jgi:D-lactate dehydrogenase